MKKIMYGLLTATLACSVALSAACAGGGGVKKSGKAHGTPDATIELRETPQTSSTEISDELFGVFLEDINYTSQAMDDNLIANGSFEGGVSGTQSRWDSSLTLSAANTGGISESAPKYATVTAQAGKKLYNLGYDHVPIAVEKDVEYVFSAFIRADDYEGDVTVRVSDGTKNYLEKTIHVKKSASWVKYETTAAATESCAEDLQAEIEFAAAGTLSLDGVQLVTKDATAGIKNYVYEAIEGLSPKFVRFPGGCIIEGKDEQTAYDWKNSIGALAKEGDDTVPELTYTKNVDGVETEVTTRGEEVTRKPNTDLWKRSEYYEMEYGVGFYEYFLLCDALGASPIPILNCGYSCMIQTAAVGTGTELKGRHGNGVSDYIQDALDLVAFANGKTDSADANEAYWANVRKDMGHAEPFNVKYLGIGNEQWGTYFTNFYEKFVEAFKEAAKTDPIYGGVQLIVGNGPNFADCQNIMTGVSGTAYRAASRYKNTGKISKISEYGIVDQHYYMNYVDFFMNTDLYDNYTRGGDNGYDVFLGEYSANQAVSVQAAGEFAFTHNNWLTALSEAAYMTGLERNGDVVKLAAYAPMFGLSAKGGADDASNQWPADMMFFTNTEILRTPNYYVQQIFAQNLGDKTLRSKLTSAARTAFVNVGGQTTNVSSLYEVVSYDDETGDVIVKIVNAGGVDLKINIDLTDIAVQPSGDGVILRGATYDAVNVLGDESVVPEKLSISGVKSKFGYVADRYSVSILRLHTK